MQGLLAEKDKHSLYSIAGEGLPVPAASVRNPSIFVHVYIVAAVVHKVLYIVR